MKKKKKKRFVTDHFGRPPGGFLGQGISPSGKPEEGVSAIREQAYKVIDGLRKVRKIDDCTSAVTVETPQPISKHYSSSRTGMAQTKLCL